MISDIVLVLVVLFVMAVASMFAGAETGTYQMSRVRLRLGIERKRLSFVILGKLMGDSSALLISILIGTNLSHYIITSVITFMLLKKTGSEHTAELFATLLTAPLLFIFCELVPKNIFFTRADRFMPRVAPILFVFKKVFTWCGLVGLLKGISGFFAKLTGSPGPEKAAMTSIRSSHIRAIFKETHEEGILSQVQTDIINHIEGISHHGIRSVMTPLSHVESVSVNAAREELIAKLKKSPFTRLCVYEGSASNIVGFVNIYEVLNSKEPWSDLQGFLQPIHKLSGNTPIADAIEIMQRHSHKIVLVTKASATHKQRNIGVITMKDLVEELLGELVEW